MIRRLILIAAAWATLGCGAPPPSDRPLLVHCTASLTKAMEDASRRFTEETGNARVQINSASSLLLRRQIEADAPGDLFVAAAPSHMDALASAKRIDTRSRVDELLRNQLSLLVSVESGIRELTDLASPHVRVGLAQEGVPAGDYARELLENAQLWEEVSKSTLRFPNEPAVVQAVQRGLVPAAFVYVSSVRAIDDDLIREIRLSPALQPEIRYPAAVLSRSRQPKQARAFLDFLRGRSGQEIFESHGFIPLIRS